MRVRRENRARALSGLTDGGKDESRFVASESASAYFTLGGDKFMYPRWIAETLKISGPTILMQGNLL
jgi:DNA-binding CsgD family transcriptional regulator